MNAMLNYGYKLAESQSCTALMSVGLDRALGWGYANRLGRPAGALDFLETVRGVVEVGVWHMVNERTFSKSDFREDERGQVWLCPPFSHALAEALTSSLTAALAPLTEDLAQLVATTAPGSMTALSVPTHLVVRKAKGTGSGRFNRPGAAPWPIHNDMARSVLELPKMRGRSYKPPTYPLLSVHSR
jgi:hypothetical protein